MLRMHVENYIWFTCTNHQKRVGYFRDLIEKKLSVYCALYDMIVIYQKLSFEIADKPSHALKNGETFLTNSTHRRRKTLSKNLVKREKGTYNKRNGDCNRKLLARLSKVCIEMELFEKMD